MAIDFNSKVTGPVSSVEGNVAVFSGTTGKVVKDSGFKIAKSVPADAKFTDTVVTVNNTLTSDSTSEALSAAQGKALKGLVDGKAASNHTHSNYAASNHTHSNYADSSHTHNYAGSSSAGGNANAAVKLATARSINGTNFDGTANITTANWGTARNITIGSSTKSVNGSANVSWSLSEIGAMSVRPSQIADNTDLNSLRDIGFYYVTTSKSAQTMKNCPTSNAFSLLVEWHHGYKQTVTEHSANGNARMWFRNSDHTGNTWGSWQEVVTKTEGVARITNNKGSNTQLEVVRTDFNKGINLTIANNGADHGLYSTYFNNWMIRGNDTEVKYAFKNEWNGQLGLIGIRCGSNLSGVSGYLTFSL